MLQFAHSVRVLFSFLKDFSFCLIATHLGMCLDLLQNCKNGRLIVLLSFHESKNYSQLFSTSDILTAHVSCQHTLENEAFHVVPFIIDY